MVLNPENTSFAAIIHYKLEPEIYCLKGLHAFENCKKKNLQNFPIHIKVDTGMHRLGFEENTIDEFCHLKRESAVKVQKYFISPGH
jgi:alanine racemase